MILTTTETISGKNLATLGLVQGNTIQSKHMFSDMGQSFKTMVGGELKSYTEMMNKARDIATQRMIDMAARMGGRYCMRSLHISFCYAAGCRSACLRHSS